MKSDDLKRVELRLQTADGLLRRNISTTRKVRTRTMSSCESEKRRWEHPGRRSLITDMAESQLLKNIGDVIAGVLPDLLDQLVKSVEDTLKTLGAASTDDLKNITENDLLPVLKPIQAQRLVAAWTQNISGTSTPKSVHSSPVVVFPSALSISSSPASSSSTSSSGICTPLIPNCLERFEIPWQRLPEELIQNLERQKRPSARQ
ncbi:hypothetical protein HF521_016899 [Silurus meridionalis]|uniref:Uncharacterized protein n=1 Tax=Silurus meridionalis TaxID=175797 RepID=A0A8T0BKP7_SILME|nr:hypothetical protein HF521_016899 [Silurus meridionalis]